MSTRDEGGGPAFPGGLIDETLGDAAPPYFSGMTLRDYFAGLALAAAVRQTWGESDGWTDTLAITAYEVADAMLAERAKEKK